MRKVVHFEIPADDLDRAKDFYGSVFGWRLDIIRRLEGAKGFQVLPHRWLVERTFGRHGAKIDLRNAL